MRLLIDFDQYAFVAAARAEEYVEWPDGICVLWSDLPTAKVNLKDDIDEILQRVGGRKHDITLCISDKENWRKWENQDYKSNRIGKRKPLILRALIDWAMETMPSIMMPGLEADDTMGILMTRDPEACVVSQDKDMFSFPGRVFNPKKMIRPQEVTLEEADRWFWTQALMGDATDGYPGCKGVGPVGAAKILEHIDTSDYEAAWATVLNTYLKKKHTRGDALMNTRMARICRDGDWDEDTQTMTWQPPTLEDNDE